MAEDFTVLEGRKRQIFEKGRDNAALSLECDKKSVAGSVSQRACVFCGSRVVLYPIADALHLVHGPIGCAVYTWDIRGSLSSGPELNRNSFSTDLRETDIIYGGEKKLLAALRELIKAYNPPAAFVYSTCIVGIIGDDVDAICRKASEEFGIPVLSVHSEGFKGTKKDGYKAACEALFRIIGTGKSNEKIPGTINILGEFNLAGESWIIRKYYEEMGIKVISTMTGDGRIEEIRNANQASLNLVQCSGSMMTLAKMMEEKYGTPYMRVSYFGIEDMSTALYAVADAFKDSIPGIQQRTEELVSREIGKLLPQLQFYRERLEGRKAAIYVGGAFKAFSLIKSLRHIGMSVVLAGSQTGNKDDYNMLKEMCDEGTVIVDDTNPVELSQFLLKLNADLLIGGVKERPIAYKLGVAFCDHNHERKIPLAGFEGMLNFAKEVYNSVSSPVWRFAPRCEKLRKGGTEI